MSTHYPISDKEKLTSVVTSCAERSETSYPIFFFKEKKSLLFVFNLPGESDVCDKWYEFSKCQFKEVRFH